MPWIRPLDETSAPAGSQATAVALPVVALVANGLSGGNVIAHRQGVPDSAQLSPT